MPLQDKSLQERIQQQMRDRALFDLHALEHNPLTHFYHVLWEGTKDWSLTMHHMSMANRPESVGHFRTRQIPDTIVWENNIPKGWYRYEEEDEEPGVWKAGSGPGSASAADSGGGGGGARGRGRGPAGRRRGPRFPEKGKIGNIKKDKVDTRKIDVVFGATATTDDDIVAVYLSRHAEDLHSGITRVDYFTRPALREFLFSKNKGKGTCILQQWVTPQNRRHNDVIQAVWTPGLRTLIDRRQNTTDLDDPRIPPHQRAATFDGPAHLSTSINCSPRIAGEVRRLCRSVADHFESNNTQGPKQDPLFRIARMVLNCKIDTHGRLVILSMGSARVEEVGRPRSLYVALDLAPRYQQLSSAPGGAEEEDKDDKPSFRHRPRDRGAGEDSPRRRSFVSPRGRAERHGSEAYSDISDDDVVAWLEGRERKLADKSPKTLPGRRGTLTKSMGALAKSMRKQPANGQPGVQTRSGSVLRIAPGRGQGRSFDAGQRGPWSKRGSVAAEAQLEQRSPLKPGQKLGWRQPRACDVFTSHELPRYRGTGCSAQAVGQFESSLAGTLPARPASAEPSARLSVGGSVASPTGSPQTSLWGGRPALWCGNGGGFILRSAPETRGPRAAAARHSTRQLSMSMSQRQHSSPLGSPQGRRKGTTAERRAAAKLADQESARRGHDVSLGAIRRLMRQAMELGDVSAWGPEDTHRLRTEYLKSVPHASLREDERMEYLYLSIGDRLRAKAAAELEKEQASTRADSPPAELSGRQQSEARLKAQQRWDLLRRGTRTGFIRTKMECAALVQELQDFVYRLESHRLLQSQSALQGGQAPKLKFALPPCPAIAEKPLKELLGRVGAEPLPPPSPSPPATPTESQASPDGAASPPAAAAPQSAASPAPPQGGSPAAAAPAAAPSAAAGGEQDPPRRHKREEFEAPEGWQAYVVTDEAPIHRLTMELSQLRKEVGKALRVRESAAMRGTSSAAACIRALDTILSARGRRGSDISPVPTPLPGSPQPAESSMFCGGGDLPASAEPQPSAVSAESMESVDRRHGTAPQQTDTADEAPLPAAAEAPAPPADSSSSGDEYNDDEDDDYSVDDEVFETEN